MTELDKMIDLFREALLLTLILAAPILGAGFLIALVVGVFQAATQVQEQTLSLIPKIVVMLLAALLAGPWILSRLVEFSRGAFGGGP